MHLTLQKLSSQLVSWRLWWAALIYSASPHSSVVFKRQQGHRELPNRALCTLSTEATYVVTGGEKRCKKHSLGWLPQKMQCHLQYCTIPVSSIILQSYPRVLRSGSRTSVCFVAWKAGLMFSSRASKSWTPGKLTVIFVIFIGQVLAEMPDLGWRCPHLCLTRAARVSLCLTTAFLASAGAHRDRTLHSHP